MSIVKILVISFLFLAISTTAALIDRAEEFRLKDYNGKEHSLSEYKDSKAIVLIFIATECPVSNDYNSRMAQLYNEYKDKGVAFLGINSNKQESVPDIKKHAKKNNLEFPILKDEKNKVADKFEASVTPEVFILNSNYEILYHGRIDDSRDPSGITDKDASKALDEILAGKKVTNVKTKAFGCTIKRV
jgi:peroxiredoxin